MKQSKFLSLNWLDLGKGLVLVILAGFFNWLQETFVPALNVSAEIKVLLITAIAYLSKNFFSGKKDEAKINLSLTEEDNSLIGTHPKDR